MYENALLWAGLNGFEEGDSWVFGAYFVDAYIAALVFGLLVARTRFIAVAAVGAIAALVCTIGLNKSVEGIWSYRSDWSLYLEATLTWVWIAGLIWLGMTLSRQLGGLKDARADT